MARRLPSPKGRSAARAEPSTSWLRSLALAAPPGPEEKGSASEVAGAQPPPLHPPSKLSIHDLTMEGSVSADPAPPTRSTSTWPPWEAVALAVGEGDGEPLAA